MIYLPISFLLVVIIDAYTDRKRTVQHKRGLILYTLACVLLSIFFMKFSDVHWYYLVSFSILTRLAVFDPIRNLFAGQRFTYEGDLNKEDRSWFDWLESKLPLSVFWKRIFYFIKYATLLIVYFYAN